MSQIEEFQGRVLSALHRISTGLETLAPESGAPDAGLVEALEQERLANAQLEERLQSVKARHADEVAALKREIDIQAQTLARLDGDLQRLRKAGQQLRESNAALRQANAEGVGAPDLINSGLQAEVEALRASRAAETAEAGAILARLEPLLVAARDGQAASQHDAEEA